MLPIEIAQRMELTLAGPTVNVTGVAGSVTGWPHPLNVALPEIDGLSFEANVVFVEGLSVALLGRTPAFEMVDIAFRHGRSWLYLEPNR